MNILFKNTENRQPTTDNRQKCKLGLLVLLITTIISCNSTNEQAGITPLENRFNKSVQDFAFILPNMKPPAGVPGIKASDCGVCHVSIYRDWQQSTHASALRDIQFQSELTKPDSPKWLCLNCHIPLQNQRDYIVVGLHDNDVLRPATIPNPEFDAVLQKEAITCATCHVRIDEANGESVIIGPQGSPNAPHPVRQDAAFLNEMCQRCHNPQGEALTPNLVCWFQTTAELAEGQASVQQAFGEKQTCVSCHMPEKYGLAADIFPHFPERMVSRHAWVGSGIPKWYEGYDSLLARGYKPGLEVNVMLPEQSGDSLRTRITVTNARSGHYLTSGDPERFLLAIAEMRDGQDSLIYRKSHRIGQTWEWSPARKVGDNRLKQGESRDWRVVLPRPEKRASAKLVVIVYHVRLNSATAAHIMSAHNVDEDLFSNGNHYVQNALDYYPFASVIFREEINLGNGKRKIYSPAALIELSKAEKGKGLEERVY